MNQKQLIPLVNTIFRVAEVDAEIQSIAPVRHGGNNNRGFVVSTNKQKYFAKLYFSHVTDPRDRLRSEFTFLSYCWNKKIHCVPKPVGFISDSNIAVYSFVDGHRIASQGLTGQHIAAAANFIRVVNTNVGDNIPMPIASEGAFSIKGHFSIIDQRIDKLSNMPIASNIDRQAQLFIDKLEEAWVQIKRKITAQRDAIRTPLSQADRCVSPSDFGFHNALVSSAGNTCFLDFEYAGWDDPAKMCCDFFCQPEIPVPMCYFDSFAETSLSYSMNSHALISRAKILLPVFQIKWCCIMLNEFLPAVAKRRSFAVSTIDLEDKKHSQLEKAMCFFDMRLATL